MSEPMHRSDREELVQLYSELHLTCARAASALRLAEHWDAPEEELLARFRKEEARDLEADIGVALSYNQ